ncbi:extracellular dioxygenase [Venturia nashicola]|uniref:Extracellular dioxygenase n=1 Tax=Venturia nashicola TaxID=86259 RepID=A0A4Z1NXV5_9PEZI|nr:extracellular dioxygenase [Venturia nashicola]TLD30109.1 extracellular dioxygenase [Venturia nashicola]
MFSKLSAILVGALLAQNIASHPGHDHSAELAERGAYLDQASRRSLDHCSEKLKARGIHTKNLARRSALAKNLREKRALTQAQYLKARDLATSLATSHHSNATYDLDTDESDIFSQNSSCILNPEVTQGPYYVAGEYIRDDVTEDQEGIPLHIEFQIIDVNTCEPVPEFYLDYWHCNSTGVYSGVVANGNGNINDTTNLNSTFLRGIQASDDDGIVSFDGLFPGHYTGRATHIHILGHSNVTIADNNTLSSQGQMSHVGQVFFDQDLINEADKIAPYSSNTQVLTLNAEDTIASAASVDVDPFMEYVLLGDSLSDGLLAWTSIGVNMSASYNISAAATIYESGGVANTNFMGGGGDAPGGNMTAGANGTAPA